MILSTPNLNPSYAEIIIGNIKDGFVLAINIEVVQILSTYDEKLTIYLWHMKRLTKWKTQS